MGTLWRHRAIWCVFALCQGIVHARTIYVTPTGTDAAGVNWAAPTSLTNALTLCTADDEIWLTLGTYTDAAPFVAGADCTLYGGFTSGMADRAERNWNTHRTILDGMGEARSVVSITGESVLLDGVDIANSKGGERYGTRSGVAKKVAGSLTLANCRLVNHTTSDRYQSGLAAYFSAGTVLMTNCVVADNAQTYRDTWGAGVYANGAELILVDCLFMNNGYAGNYYLGTALAVNGSKLTAIRTDFIANSPGASTGNGTVYIHSGTGTSALFSNCVFRGNQAAAAGYGGAMRVNLPAGGLTEIVNCTFTDNGLDSLSGYGGAIYMSAGTLNVRNSVFWNNAVAAGSGNGHELYVAGGTCTVRYSLLTGIALANVCGPATLENCLTGDPLFASATDLHLKSATGRWDTDAGTFVTTDTGYSPCLDAGDPADAIGGEVAPNGDRANMGRFGGTAEASKSAPNTAPLLADSGAVVNFHRAKVSAELTNNTYVTAEVGLCYGTNSVAGQTTNGWDYVEPFDTAKHTGEVFSATTPALEPTTHYYYRWYATNTLGSDWTPVAGFDTLSASAGGGPAVIHVDPTATAGADDGTDWANAYLSLAKAAVEVNGTRTNIWVTGGHYQEGLLVTLSSTANLTGGFEGTETAVSDRALTNALGVATNYTVIDGDATHGCLRITAGNVGLDALSFVNTRPLVPALQKGGTGHLVLNNARIVDNNIGYSRYAYGIGAYFSAGTVFMTNCEVANNTATYRDGLGSGVYALGADLDIVDCLFTNNNYGGAIVVKGTALAVNNGRLTVRNTAFIDNTGSSKGGGTVYLGSGAATSAAFSNCVFRHNQTATEGSGGAMWVQLAAAGSASIVNCTFTENTRNHTLGYGGAIYLSSGTLDIRNSILWTNTVATGSAGGQELYVAGGTLNVRYSALTGTTSPHIYGSGTFENCLTSDPLFAGATDVHLQSKAGRWDPTAGTFVTTDSQHSLCIDSADPGDPVGDEADPNGSRINMGAYGGTAQASKSPANASPKLAGRGAVVSYNRATVSGELTNDILVTAQVGLCYGTNNVIGDATNGWEYVDPIGAPQQTGVVFSASTAALEPTTTYFYRWYATNDYGIDWTTAATFETDTAPPGGGPDVIHVRATATGTGDGTDWINAYPKLSDAITALGGTRTNIWITGDTYRDGVLVTLSSGASVIGGFQGTESAAAQRALTNALGVVTNYTVIDGQAAHGCIKTTAGDVWLDTLVFSNTASTVSALAKTGAGRLVVNNCRMEHNATASRDVDGLGANFSGGTVLMTNCLVADNVLSYIYGVFSTGGGVYGSGVDLTIADCLFTNNGVGTGPQVTGTALSFNGGSLKVFRTDFIDNVASIGTSAGGVVHLGNAAAASSLFSNCVFRGNHSAGQGQGGAMWANLASDASATAVNCTFTDNVRDNILGYGGAIYLSAGTLDIRNSILWSNAVAEGSSGGQELYAAGGTLNVRYSALTGTTSPYIYGPATFENCLTADPLFAGASDVHLRSGAGRWLDGTFVTTDTDVSPCIDAGNPADAVASEPAPNGDRINMGAYGGTAQASKSPPNAAPLLRDLAAVVNYHRAEVTAELTNDTYITAAVGLCYGPSSIPGDTTNGWEHVTPLGAPQHAGSIFSVTTPALTPHTTYWYRWYATNEEGTDWTSLATFDTGDVPPGGGPDVIHVNRLATGADDGIDWVNAYTKISDGVSALSGTRTNIWVTGGTYAEGAVVTLAQGARIIGGFTGTENVSLERTLTDARGAVTNYTAIDGQTTHTCLAMTGGNVWLEALAVSNSAAAGSLLTKSGTGALVLNNCRLEHNNMPGGVVARNLKGMGANFSGGSVIMTNCLVADIAQTYRDNAGIGVYASGTDLTIEDSLFSSNRITGFNVKGAGLAFGNGTLNVRRTVFRGNLGRGGTASGGGAVYLDNTATLSASFTSCLFFENGVSYHSTPGYGGAVWANLNAANAAEFVNCTFAGNTNASGHGGAIYLTQGTLNVKNCVLWTNGVSLGGYTGHEIYADGPNSLVAFDHSCLTSMAEPVAVTANSAVLQWGDGMLTDNPLFEDADAGDFRLSRGSPCVNAGINVPAMQSAADLTGGDRIQGGIVDMGAYELPPAGGTVFLIR